MGVVLGVFGDIAMTGIFRRSGFGGAALIRKAGK